MKRRQLISADEAILATHQHTEPCADCPWTRESLPGWTGTLTPDEWIAVAHGEALVECHTRKGAQCAGLAIYRANVFKRPRDNNQLRLPADREVVFASPAEFRQHHEE